MKGIAKTRIEHGELDKDGKNAVRVFEEGKAVDLPDDIFAALESAGAVERAAAPAGRTSPPAGGQA